MAPSPRKNDFDLLDPSVKAWLQSESVFSFTLDLNKQIGAGLGATGGTIPTLIVGLVTGVIKPENFAQEVDRQLYFIDAKTAEHISEVLKSKIFGPIAAPLKKAHGIDVEKINTKLSPETSTQPTAQTTQLAKPLVADIKKPVAPTQTVPVRVNSQMTATAQTIRLGQGIGSESNKNTVTPKAAVAQPKPPAQHADNLTLQKPISFIEVQPLPPAPEPAAAAVAKPQPAPAAPTTPIAPREAPTPVKSTPAAPITQNQPVKHEVEAYEDHHPVVE
jgi:hypothetical protein